MKLPKQQESSFERCPEGTHLAVCYEVIDLGTQQIEYQGVNKLQRKIWIGWELPNETMSDGRPFVVGKRYTLSSFERATLRKHLEAWRGKRFTEEELGPNGSFDIRNVIGAGCFLSVIHSEYEGNTYSNVEAVSALPKGTQSPPLVNQRIYLSLEPEDFDERVLDSLSERMQELIKASPEYYELKNGTAKPADLVTADDEVPF
jgi:hypothetical protein